MVITHRPNDYHPDHRFTSVFVQDSAYMVTVLELLSSDPERQKSRWRAIRERFTNRQLEITSRCRKSLEECYGAKRAAQIVYTEAFEVGEYGRRPDATELKRLFPFFD